MAHPVTAHADARFCAACGAPLAPAAAPDDPLRARLREAVGDRYEIDTLLDESLTDAVYEAVDVRHFAQADPLFPHDSTSNQFFDEARFESYRDLGFHTVLSATGGAQGLDSAASLLACVTSVFEKQALAATPETA